MVKAMKVPRRIGTEDVMSLGFLYCLEVLINDALASSLKVPQTSLKLFCDELVTKIVSSWNEPHRLTTVMKRLFLSLISFVIEWNSFNDELYSSLMWPYFRHNMALR